MAVNGGTGSPPQAATDGHAELPGDQGRRPGKAGKHAKKR